MLQCKPEFGARTVERSQSTAPWLGCRCRSGLQTDLRRSRRLFVRSSVFAAFAVLGLGSGGRVRYVRVSFGWGTGYRNTVESIASAQRTEGEAGEGEERGAKRECLRNEASELSKVEWVLITPDLQAYWAYLHCSGPSLSTGDSGKGTRPVKLSSHRRRYAALADAGDNLRPLTPPKEMRDIA